MLRTVLPLVAATLTAWAVNTSPPPAAAATMRPTTTAGVVIDQVKVRGANCRPGTVAVALSLDHQAFTVTYSEYIAAAGGPAKKGDATQKCGLDLRINVPAGMTYAVSQADYRGFAYLAAGATGVQRASYRRQGDPQPTPVSHTFAGPFDDYWQATDRIDPAQLTFGPCGKARTFSIDTELEVAAGSADPAETNMIAMDSADSSVTSTYHLAVKACS